MMKNLSVWKTEGSLEGSKRNIRLKQKSVNLCLLYAYQDKRKLQILGNDILKIMRNDRR
nr:MAG TPA: hypothetical protein [Caudoviricetes sp.]